MSRVRGGARNAQKAANREIRVSLLVDIVSESERRVLHVKEGLQERVQQPCSVLPPNSFQHVNGGTCPNGR